MTRMKMLCALGVLGAFAVAAEAGAGKKGMTKTLTGCLQKGTMAGHYMLTNVEGGPAATNKDWMLMDAPAALKLDEHVGHKVSITGKVVGVGAATKTEQKTTTTATDPAVKVETTKEMTKEMKVEHDRHLKVTSMKHIAATCP